MKKICSFLFVLCVFGAQAQDDYVIRINDTSLNVELGKKYNMTVNGRNVSFSVKLKDTLTHADNLYSFLYLSHNKISQTKLDSSISQISILTAEGSGLLIQEYQSINPTSLNEMMLSEVTKESINYGFEMKRSTYKKKLQSGQEIEVTRAVLRYKDEVNIYEIASAGTKDAGLVIVTMRMSEMDDTPGQNIIRLMWDSLRLKW